MTSSPFSDLKIPPGIPGAGSIGVKDSPSEILRSAYPMPTSKARRNRRPEILTKGEKKLAFNSEADILIFWSYYRNSRRTCVRKLAFAKGGSGTPLSNATLRTRKFRLILISVASGYCKLAFDSRTQIFGSVPPEPYGLAVSRAPTAKENP